MSRDYMTLLGAEDVDRAASSMRQAADQLGSAVGSFGHNVMVLQQALEQHQGFMRGWLEDFEAALAKHKGGNDGQASTDKGPG